MIWQLYRNVITKNINVQMLGNFICTSALFNSLIYLTVLKLLFHCFFKRKHFVAQFGGK
jgi:hypothetical protein